MSRECMFLGSLSRHNKDLERRTLALGSVIALFYLEDSKRERERRERERDKEKSARTRERESERKRFGSSFYMFFPPPGPALCKLGLARSVVCSVCSA